MEESQTPIPSQSSDESTNSNSGDQLPAIPQKKFKGKKVILIIIGLICLILVVLLSPFGINKYCEQGLTKVDGPRCKLEIGPHFTSPNKLIKGESTPYLTILINEIKETLTDTKKESLCPYNGTTSGTVHVLPPFSTVGWKTYTNTFYGFSFKYPENRFYKIDDNLGKLAGKFPLSLFFYFDTNKPSSKGITHGLNLTIIEQSSISEKRGENQENVSIGPEDCEEVVVGGEKALRQPSHTGQHLIGEEGHQEYKSVISNFSRNGKRYYLTMSPRTPADYDLYDQIISTFTFLPTPSGTILPTQSLSTDISTWKTFAGASFSFKYPNGASIADAQNYTSIGLTSSSVISIQTIPLNTQTSIISAFNQYKGTTSKLPYITRKVNGEEAIEVDLPTANEKWYINGIYVIHNKKLYILKLESIRQQTILENSKTIFNNFLSTFKFSN